MVIRRRTCEDILIDFVISFELYDRINKYYLVDVLINYIGRVIQFYTLYVDNLIVMYKHNVIYLNNNVISDIIANVVLWPL